VGKWQTSDPLGYPDGWNNLAYCNNGVTSCYDWLGTATRGIHGRTVNVPGNPGWQHSWTSLNLTSNEYNNIDSKFKEGIFQNRWAQNPDGTYSIKLSAYDSSAGFLEKK
jgi:uncharacterized protein RhaS with RHS repeats